MYKMKASRMNRRATRRQSRKSRQNRKGRKSRKYQGGFVRGTSPILNAGVFSGNSTWNKPGASMPMATTRGYTPFAQQQMARYTPFAQTRRM